MAEDQQQAGYRSPAGVSDFTLSSRSVLEMPLEGSRKAPKQFKGDPSDVEPFLRKYERLATLYGLSDQEKCQTILDYCGRLEDIWVYWNADLESKRFRVKDLQRFVATSKEEPIIELKDWQSYLRRFIRIGGWLLGQKKISEREYAYYLWTGLHPAFRHQLEARILISKPEHDMSEPFSLKDIDKAAKALLSVDRFDTERLRADDSYDDDSDDSGEESDRIRRVTSSSKRKAHKPSPKLKKRIKEDYEKKQERNKKLSGKKLPEKTTRSKDKEEELSELYDQLSRLSLNDKDYAVAFMKARLLEPSVEEYIPKPITSPPVQFVSQNSQSNVQDMPRDMPPHMGRPGSNQFMGQRPTGPPSRSKCYGCGDPGHVMNSCPKLQEMYAKGILKRNFQGQFTDKDGQLIERNYVYSVIVKEWTIDEATRMVYPTSAQTPESAMGDPDDFSDLPDLASDSEDSASAEGPSGSESPSETTASTSGDATDPFSLSDSEPEPEEPGITSELLQSYMDDDLIRPRIYRIPTGQVFSPAMLPAAMGPAAQNG
ncbi:hypothetical protein OH77DRAFT_1440539 [Trametes cingulata]|nr:hypothetical protein OH77DRAFT_1440539 [Trametes cingulata]